ncbi:hypothetical protein WN55_01325 [Dufourea novaeangliae]|uniref:Uncharacterized protein n=1 Tax=Dufourea novaeangliae TaxID=178035 RepID=A0A154PD65_DUFNO|nr:hypothetical protein WN55_01325 [Dufourea novaeangliae]
MWCIFDIQITRREFRKPILTLSFSQHILSIHGTRFFSCLHSIFTFTVIKKQNIPKTLTLVFHFLCDNKCCDPTQVGDGRNARRVWGPRHSHQTVINRDSWTAAYQVQTIRGP